MVQRITLVMTGVLSLIAGCVWVLSPQPLTVPALAYAETMPETPHIIYVGAAGKAYGELTEEVLEQHKIMILRDWDAAKKQAASRPLDALLTETELLSQTTDDDQAWLRAHLERGVILAGLGVNLDHFAQVLGLETLRVPGEADVPLGPDGAYLVHGFIIGQADDVALMRANDWLKRSLQGTDASVPGIKASLMTSTGRSREALSSQEGIDEFFQALYTAIEGIYRTRTEYQQSIEPAR